MPARRRARRLTASGSLQRQHGDVQHDAVGHHDRVIARGERRVEQPERADRALELARERAALQAHAVAHAERARAQQHRAGDHVAERLLGRETEDHRRERAAEGERARFDARHAQRHEQRQHDRHQADQEPDRAGGGRVQAPEQRRPEPAADVARDRPAEDHQRDHRRRTGVQACSTFGRH